MQASALRWPHQSHRQSRAERAVFMIAARPVGPALRDRRAVEAHRIIARVRIHEDNQAIQTRGVGADGRPRGRT